LKVPLAPIAKIPPSNVKTVVLKDKEVFALTAIPANATKQRSHINLGFVKWI
jgi:hypothetical protein